MISDKKKKKLIKEAFKGLGEEQKKNTTQYRPITNSKGEIEHVGINSNATSYDPLKIGDSVKWIPQDIKASIPQGVSFDNENSYNNYVNNLKGVSYYGNNLSYNQVKSYISDLKSNSMAAVKDPDYSTKLKFLNDYSINYGYKDKKYANEYISEINKQIESLKKEGYQKLVRGSTIYDKDKWVDVDGEPYYMDNNQYRLKYQKEIDDLNDQKAKFEAQREVYKRTTVYEDNYKKFESEKDYNTYAQKGASFENGYKTAVSDNGKDKFSFLHFEDAEATHSEELEEYRLKEAFSPVSVYGLDIYLHDNERKTYNYLLGKYGEEKASEYFKSMEATLNLRKNDYANEAHTNFAENADTKAKIFENVATTMIKPVGIVESNVANVTAMLSGKKVDPYDSYHQISNTVDNTRESEAEYIQNKNGKIASTLYQAGTSVADYVWDFVIATMFGGDTHIVGALMGLDSANSYIKTAYDRGLDENQIYIGAALTGLAEGTFEKFSLDKIIKMKPGGLKNIIINTLKSAGIEASEEAATEIADIFIDNAVAMQNSENNLEKERLINEEGLNEQEAARKVFTNNCSDVLWSGVGGGLAGLGFGGISNTVQYNKNKSIINSESSQNFGKNALISDNQQEIIDTAKRLGIDTKKAEFAVNNLNETARITEQSPNETNQAAYNEAFKTASKEIATLELYIEQSNENVTENTESNIGNEIIDDNTESNIDVTGEADNRKSVADTLKRNNKLAHINETAKSETALQDLTEHIDEEYYKIVYNETVNVEDGNPSTAHAVPLPLTREALVGEDGNASADKEGDHTGYATTNSTSVGESTNSAKGFSATERSAEFNRIYDMGTDEDIPPHEIESDIFTPEQVRRIYAAAVIDDNKRNNYSEQVKFTELLKEYEDKAAIAQFGNETVKNIMTASAEQVKSAAQKLGINVEFVKKVPGKNPNADGAYNPKTNTIYININTKYPMQQVFLHELTHFFESADNYSEFQNTIFKSRAFKKWLGKYTNLKNDKYKSIDEYRNTLKDRYGEKDDTKINREMVAFFVSDNLFQKDFGDLGRLATELTGSKKERFISFIKNIFKRFKNAVSGIDKLEKKFLSLYRTAGQNKNTDNNNGVKQMSIEKTIDNKPVVIVENNILDGVPKKDWIKTVKQTISDKFSSGIPISGRLIKVNAITKNEFTKSKYSQFLRATDGTIYADKFKSANNLDEILLATTNYVNEDLKHIRKDKIKEFARGDVLIRVGNNDYSAKVIVGFTGTNMLLYDIVEFTPTNFTIKKRIHQEFGESRTPRNDVSSNTNISQKDNGVNSSISENSKNDTDIPQMNTGEDIDSEYMSAVKNGDTQTAQSLVDEEAKAKGYNSPMLYHGTADFGFTEFDLNKMDDNRSIFLTSSKEIASTYSGIEGINKISERNNVDIDKLSIQETVELLNRHAQEPTIDYSYSYMDMKDILELRKKVNGDIKKLDGILKNLLKKYSSDFNASERLRNVINAMKQDNFNGLSVQLWLVSERTELFNNDKQFISELEENIRLLQKINEHNKDDHCIVEKALDGYHLKVLDDFQTKERLKKVIKKGNYSLYAKLENPLIVEAGGNYWNSIDYIVPYDRYEIRGGYSEGTFEVFNRSTMQPEWIKGKHYWGTFEEAQKALDTLEDKQWEKRLNTTREISEYAQEQGYDSVIFKNLIDNGGNNVKVSDDAQADIYIIFNPNNVKSADPVVYDDNGDVIPLSERFDDSKSDIRYMLSEEDKFDNFGNYFDEDENGEVTFISAEQYQDELKKNPKIGVLDKQQIERKSKAIIKKYQSRINSADVASQLNAIYNDIKNIDENGNHARPKVEKLANDIYDNIVEKVSNGEVYEQLKDILQGSKMLWTDEVKTAFGSDWNDFIRKNRHRLNLIKADSGKVGIGIDVMYDNLCRELPGFFDGNAQGPKAQLNEMLDVLNGQQFVYDTFLDDNKEDIINQIISDIYGGFAQIDYIKKGSDKAKSQTDYKFDNQYLDEYGIDDKRFKADMRKQINEKSADFVKEQKKKYKDGEISAEQFADSLTDHFARVSLTAKIKPLESYYKASDKYRERFKQINERTTKNLKELRTMLQNPTEGKYIPADLVELVEDVLNIGDNQNFKLRDKLKRYRDTLSRADIDEGILDVYKQAIDKCEDELSKQNLGQVFAEISRKYNSYKTGKAENTQAGEFEQSFYCYHEAVAQKLEQVAATLENADMTRLTMRQAEALDEGLNCLTHFVKNSVKAIGLTESAHIAEVGHDMIQETKATAVHKNFASKMLNTAINTELSPERMFRRMGGYAPDSMWVKMADMLTEGQTQAEVIKQRLKDVIAPALNGENMKNAENARSYKNKDLVDIGLVDENGESVKVPHSFMISAYLHLQNEANQNHALKGGFEIPDFRTYYKGKISKSFTEGKIKARFTDVTSALKKLEQNMSEYDKLVAKNVALLFDTHTKAEYNKINMDVFGFEKAKVKHYFPIYSSNDFIATGFDTSYEASLKNQGNMKSRVAGAVNPIKLMDVFDVVDKEISRCGEYCGKLKAEITMTRVYNTTTAEFGTSLKEQIGLHFGESGKKYIEHLMQDYSGTRKTENSVALSKLRGAVATSALMGNINVAMKQAGSYPTAAATIGWKPLLKALAVSDEGAKVFYRANRQLIDKYTPWLRYRTEGYSTQEIADLKNLSFYNKRQMKWLFGWINAADIATVGRLWQAAQYYVDDNNVELKKGTDEYYKQVAKVFNKIIFDTQPNYTVMQRPDILRNPNSLLKSMIMFSTQPLQNLGILYDSAMNYNAQLKAFKQGKVEKSVLQEAKRGLARGISSIVVSAGVISLMTLLAKAIRGKLDDYLDKYGEFNAVGILNGSLKVFGSTLAGMVTFGSEIYNFIMSAVTGDTYYGVNISSIDLISDVFESFINEITAVKNQKDILNKTVAFVEKASALFGFPARNIKNLFGGVTNLISTGDWFALNEKKTDSQYYAQMYDCCINGENEKYNKLYNELLERGKTVNEIEGGIKTCLKEAESDDVKEAAQALIDGDNKIYNDIINEFISRGFDEKIVLETVDEVADKLKGDELTDEQKKTKEKSKYTYMQNLLNKINFSGLTSKQKAEAQQEVEKMADEYGYQAATGEPKNATYDNALKSDKAGVVPAKDFVIAKTLLQKKYADTDGDGNVSAQEKYDAIQKSNIPSDIKKLLQAMNIMGSKKIDTDNDGKTDTAFDDLQPSEQKAYIDENNSDILKMLEDTNASAEKSEIKANYRAKLESKINVFDYKEKYRSDVQNEIDYLSSAAADIDINGDTDSSTAKAFLHFDESGFIDIADYVKFYVNAKKYTKNEEKLEVINQLDISDNAKLRLKLWTVASGWSLDSDGDGKRDKRISTYSPEFQEKWIKENAGYIQSNCSYWR